MTRFPEPDQLALEQLETRYPAGKLVLPAVVREEDDFIVWRVAPTKPRTRGERHTAMLEARAVHGRADLLREFVSLRAATNERIVDFAKKAGVLGLCKHGAPASHAPPRVDSKGRRDLGCEPLGWNGSGAREPIALWRLYARRAAVLLRIAQRLREDGEPAAFSREDAELCGFALDAEWRTPQYTRGVLATAVNVWIDDGGMRLRLVDNGRGLELGLTPIGMVRVTLPLFGTLGLQLALAVSGERGLVFCNACKKAFEPTRRLVAGFRHFCSTCGIKAMRRMATADYRERQRKKGVPGRSHMPRKSGLTSRRKGIPK